MKKFTFTGPKTSKEIEIADDEMIEWSIIKIADYESSIRTCEFCNGTWRIYCLHCPHCGRKPKRLVEVGG